MISQKKNMIEAKASKFLEDKSSPHAIASQSPIIEANGRRMTTLVE